LSEAARDRYEKVIEGLGVNDIGQSINDLINSWPIYLIALVSTFIVT